MTVPSNAGFITGTTVVFIPLFYCALIWQMPGTPVVVALALALVGLLLASGFGVQSLTTAEASRGDALLLLAALFNAAHVVLMRVAAQRGFGVGFIAIQVIAMTVLVGTYAALTGEVDLAVSHFVVATAFVTGFYAIGILLLVQLWAQRLVSPIVAGLIFTSEPVFAALTGYLWINERFTALQVVGFGIILAAMIVAELRRLRAPPPAGASPIAGRTERDHDRLRRVVKCSDATKGEAAAITVAASSKAAVSKGVDR